MSLETLSRANAQNCYDAILTALKDQVGLDPEEVFGRLVGFASDGAAVMQVSQKKMTWGRGMHTHQIKDHSQTSTDSKGKSAGFLKTLMSREIIEFCHFMVDVLAVLSRLSQSFQRRDISIGEVPQLVSEAVSSLTKLKTRPGPNLRSIKKTPGYFQDRQLDGEPVDQDKLNECVSVLLDCLAMRLLTSEHTQAIATLIDFKTWPVEKEDGISM
ncbi:hypothetical protein HOLleu_02490 [Holothuria leucospilota]|uniref:Uncharacterized protein n=1 Tax=Holothuria leucospilota TaxID=206669 RepID=A0A9Q1CPP3_HOLLE|nr:hypothetical protein HOLleu_02490 [Holothuria leucospilota]